MRTVCRLKKMPERADAATVRRWTSSLMKAAPVPVWFDGRRGAREPDFREAVARLKPSPACPWPAARKPVALAAV